MKKTIRKIIGKLVKPKVIIIAGPSGVGKTTTIKKVVGMGVGIELLNSVTTRPRRKGERSGDGRIFLSKGMFQLLNFVGLLGCVKETNGVFYALPVWKLFWKSYYIFDFDIEGIKKFKKEFSFVEVLVIGLYQTPEVCKQRMEARGDTPEAIAERLRYDEEAFKDIEAFVDVLIYPQEKSIEETTEIVWKTIKHNKKWVHLY